MSKKISVYGGTGFIGSRFCAMFPDDVINIERESNESKSANILYFISTVDNYNIHTDLTVDIDTNLLKLMKVLRYIKDNKDEKDFVFNFISSWFVYGQNNEIPFKEETSKCNPTGFYSITKHCAEQLLISFCQTFNVKYRIFRLANVIGEGDNKISNKKNALQFLIKEAVNNNNLPLYYGGEVLRDYIYVDDVCDAIKLCIDKAPVNQIINIGSGIPYRFIDIINKAITYSDSQSVIEHINPTNFHNIVQVRHSYLDTTKLQSYGFIIRYNINSIVERLVDYYKRISK
jgi:nucleoside-diphosphate-sugar epimerase